MVKRFISTIMITGALIGFSMTEQSIVKASEPTQAEIDAAYAEEDAKAADVMNNWDKFVIDKLASDGITKAAASSSNPDFRPGDILVTMDNGYASFRWGHAAIVYWANQYTMESYSSKGVQLHSIDKWKPSSKMKTMIALKVKNATYQAKEIARKFAGDQKGKPYNYNFLKPERTDAYYCSSLIWRAYKEAGHGINGGLDKIVTPYDIVQDRDTTGYYVK